MSKTKGSSDSLYSLDASFSERKEEITKFLKNNKVYGLVQISDDRYSVATSTKELAQHKEEDIVMGEDLLDLVSSIRKPYKESPNLSRVATHEIVLEHNDSNYKQIDGLIIKKRKIPYVRELPKDITPAKLYDLVRPFGTVKLEWGARYALKENIKAVPSIYDNQFITNKLFYTGRTGTLTVNTKTINTHKKARLQKNQDAKCLGLHETKFKFPSQNINGYNLYCPYTYCIYSKELRWNTDYYIQWKVMFKCSIFRKQFKAACESILPYLDFIVNNANLAKARNRKEVLVYKLIKAFRNKVYETTLLQ